MSAIDLDLDRDDFIAQFDREFGAHDEPAAEDDLLPDDDGGPPDDDGGPPWRRRLGRRIVRRPHAWLKRPWPAGRVVRVTTTIASLAVTTFIMMRVVSWDPLRSGADLINDDTTPTGGDMGAHVWGPAFLRDHLLPNWQLSGWSMDWYGGLPVYRFYMVIPALAIVALDTVLPYGVAFKYVVISGLVTLPICCWAFGRLARFRYPIPEAFAFAALCFALNESKGYHLLGGNVLSTMAGEFSFSIAVSLMILGWGLLARGLDDGTFRSSAAIILALAALSHGIVLIYTALGAVVIVACRLAVDARRRFRPSDTTARTILTRRTTYAASVGALTLLLCAFWVGPFLFNHDYMTDMKYTAQPSGSSYDSFWEMFFDQHIALDVVVNALAIAGLVGCIVRRHVYGIALGVIGVVAVALVYLTRDSLPIIGLLWNPRVLPLVYFVRYLMMMIGAVEVGGAVINFVRNRPPRDAMATAPSALILGSIALVVLVSFGWLFQALPLGGHVTKGATLSYAWGPFHAPDTGGDGWTRSDSWPAYNFQGYEGRTVYPEYYDVVRTMSTIGDERGCGRALWENNSDLNKPYGTSMALMLLPFWTNGCIGSMEGLFFEASGTTPYHFLAGSAVSLKASNPVRQLRYVRNDAEVGVDHARALGVRYVMVRTAEAIDEADAQADLTPIAESGPWQIYEVAGFGIVEALDVQPVVVNGRGGDQRERFLELGTSWFQNRQDWAAMPADDGPPDWQRIDVEIDATRERDNTVSVVEPVQDLDVVELPDVAVTDVEIDQQELSFEVSQVGVPILVRVSYFPNWSADGADGPYRIGPNQMVVVPTESEVRLRFQRSASDLVFYALTLAGVALAVFFRLRGNVNVTATRMGTDATGEHPVPARAVGRSDAMMEGAHE